MYIYGYQSKDRQTDTEINHFSTLKERVKKKKEAKIEHKK